jgi:hypothetical protein
LRLAASAPSGPEWLHVAAKPEQLGESVTPPGGAPLPDFTKAREALKVLWGSYAAEVIGSVLDAAELALASQQQENEKLRADIRSFRETLTGLPDD